MANATVIHGPYGYFYPYVDENGDKRGIKLFDDIYNSYYSPGYLTDQDIDDMLNGKTITFSIPKQTKTITIKAKIVPYITKQGKASKIIQFEEPDQVDDSIIIKANLEKIACSYWTGERFNYTKPQEVLDSLDLMHVWKTYATYKSYSNISFGIINIYRSKSKKDTITIYCRVDKNTKNCEYISEEKYNAEISSILKKLDEEYTKAQEEQNKVDNIKKEMFEWLDNIINTIWPNETNNPDIIIANADIIVSNISPVNLEDRVRGLLNAKSFNNTLKNYIDIARNDIKYDINRSTYNDKAVCDKIKTRLLDNIKVYVEYLKIKHIRTSLLNKLSTEGLDSMTSAINIDVALNLGYFPQVQKILVKYKQDTPKYIISNMYLDVIDPNELNERLLNMLKVYYDFYDMPEKDRKAVAKFIAKNKLKDYYDRISKFDDVLETLIDESRDPRLTKPLLESIAGTSRANVLKDKTFYFEKHGRLRSEIILYKPIELLDKLRSLIKIFNASSDVAILTNIELDADESFIFQFYTFAGSENAENEFDGRRMLNLTRIFNRQFAGNDKTKKIGFIFDNSESIDDEDE